MMKMQILHNMMRTAQLERINVTKATVGIGELWGAPFSIGTYDNGIVLCSLSVQKQTAHELSSSLKEDVVPGLKAMIGDPAQCFPSLIWLSAAILIFTRFAIYKKSSDRIWRWPVLVNVKFEVLFSTMTWPDSSQRLKDAENKKPACGSKECINKSQSQTNFHNATFK